MKFTTHQPKVLVVGSSSIDLVLSTDKHPMPMDTIIAHKSETYFGGKGANQAVGTSRLGASVYFIGCVGMDPRGQQIMRHLIEEGVNVGFVVESERHSTGSAYVADFNGKNTIIVSPSANFDITNANIDITEKLFSTTDLILLQLEIPIGVVEHTVSLAKKHGKKVGIYASPAKTLSKEVLDYVSFLVVKSNELTAVFGDVPREEILQQYPNKLFVRDDTNSTIFFDSTEMKYYRNESAEIANTMGMGDAFTSGFAIAFCHGNSIDDCVQFGNVVSRKVSEKQGSQSGLPYRKDF